MAERTAVKRKALSNSFEGPVQEVSAKIAQMSATKWEAYSWEENLSNNCERDFKKNVALLMLLMVWRPRFCGKIWLPTSVQFQEASH